MDLNLSAFQEPRGVMRLFHCVFSICAFATVVGYTGYIHYTCLTPGSDTDSFSYPFDFAYDRNFSRVKDNVVCNIAVVSPSSSDAKFFVATGVLTMLFTLALIVVYTKFDEMYKRDRLLLTVVFGVLWLSSSAAWANGLSGLKEATNLELKAPECIGCFVSSDTFLSLNISVVFGFLNFFLWAADLWFVYKETAWFQGNQPHTADGV